jgi:hypothetical protein
MQITVPGCLQCHCCLVIDPKVKSQNNQQTASSIQHLKFNIQHSQLHEPLTINYKLPPPLHLLFFSLRLCGKQSKVLSLQFNFQHLKFKIQHLTSGLSHQIHPPR